MSNTVFSVKKHVLLPLLLLLTLFLFFMPTEWLHIDGLTLVQQRTIALFVFAAFMWIIEIVPAWATSIITMVLLIFTVSNGAFSFLTGGDNVGTLVSYKDFMAQFASPTIMLFMGGFVLAIAATKVGLDVVLAKVLLKPFGTNPKTVLLGILLVVAIFSMFMSNTATAAMMLAFLAPVLKSLPADGKGKIGLALAIPIGANIGGIGTPIGTPPNVIALGYLKENLGIEVGFGEWCVRMVPYVLVMLLIAWIFLLLFFPFKAKEIKLEINSDKKKDYKFWVVAATFIITIALWLIPEKITNLNSNEVALIPFAIFVATGVFEKKDFAEINWDVLWMVAGGLALGTALMKTGLAKVLVDTIPFSTMPALVVILVSGIVGYAIANFLSHTSAANLLLPILATVAAAVDLSAFGGSAALLIGLAISTSVAMILPISTPPNAIASSTGLVETKDMAKMGIIMGIVGLILGYGVLIFVGF
ncbi:MAG: SLC13 family permease [Bacteroidales bacterium]|nr:SLC13/DASS family transporter [Candidatus Cryptobacteroides faecihippi]MCQ2162187.1 SLC13 family permease [Bacteroidales bacterium]